MKELLDNKSSYKMNMNDLNNYMIIIRELYDTACKSEDTTIKQKAYRTVCDMMFKGLFYGLDESKLNKLYNTITLYIEEKKL